jgi:hypothetical protein
MDPKGDFAMLRACTTTSPRRLTALALGLAAFGLASLGAPSPARAQDAQVENGFALQANLAVRASLVTVNAGTNTATLPGYGLDTQLFGGYKFGRVLIGLGLEFLNTTANSSVGNMSTNSSVSEFLIGPEAQFAIVRSGDGRVELIGDLAIHFGHAFVSPDPNTNDTNFLLSYQIGPGVRFWAHKHFAITGLTGFSGELVHATTSTTVLTTTTTTTSDTSVHGILGSIGLMGVF